MASAGTAPALDARTRLWRWRIFSATYLSYAGLYFCRKPFFISKAALEDELGFNAELLGMIGATYLIAYAIGQFLSGALGNKFGPRVVLLVGMGASIAANVVFGLANSWATFATFMAVNGLFQATGWSCNLGTMAQWYRRRERGTVMGVWATNFQVGGVAANALAAWVLDLYGFRWSFFTGSMVLAVVWVYFLFNQRNRPQDVGLAPIDDPEETPESEQPKGLGWTRQMWFNILLIGVFYFFLKLIRYAIWSWAPYLLKRHYGLELDDAGYVSTIFDVAGVAGVFTLGLVSDRLFGGRRAQASFLFVLGLLGACTMLYLVGSTSIVLFAISIGLIGFTLYGPDAIMTSAGTIDASSRRSATMAAGIINGMGSIGSVLQELVLGRVLGDGDVDAVFLLLLISASLSAVCLAWILVRNHKGRADV